MWVRSIVAVDQGCPKSLRELRKFGREKLPSNIGDFRDNWICLYLYCGYGFIMVFHGYILMKKVVKLYIITVYIIHYNCIS